MIDLALARAAMADRIAAIGFPAPVVAAMRAVPRNAFVPRHFWRLAYADADLWLGTCTLPAPVSIARRLGALSVRPGERVLEVGTGCGYQTALLAELGATVFTIETAGAFDLSEGALGARAGAAVNRSLGGGVDAWCQEAPFDAIVVNDLIPVVPQALTAQMAEAGRLVAIIEPAGEPGGGVARLTVVRRYPDGMLRFQDAGPFSHVAAPTCPAVAVPRLGIVPILEGMRSEP